MSGYHHRPPFGPGPAHGPGPGGVVVVETPGIQGPRGEPGPKGEDGITPDISVAVETLPAGSAATVEKTGTKEEPKITLGIPRGDKGDKGDQGEPGKDAEIPTVSNSFIDNLF